MGNKYLMTCGHVSNAKTAYGAPACVICDCFDVEREIKVDQEPKAGLEGRVCVCHDCGTEHSSAWTLPFFQYRPWDTHDTCYDGCYGWD